MQGGAQCTLIIPRMKLVVAVHFDGAQANAAAVAFDAWDAAEPLKTYVSPIAPVEKAVRGAVDLREVACVMQLLREHGLTPELLLIDGFVHLDTAETPGVGRHLHEALGGSIPVVAMILTLVHVPAEGIGMILGVDRFLDMCRTTLNVSGDLAAAVVISRGEAVEEPGAV